VDGFGFLSNVQTSNCQLEALKIPGLAIVSLRLGKSQILGIKVLALEYFER
jgi:hypothetical protein